VQKLRGVSIAPEAVCAEMQRILASKAFLQSQTLSQLLRFLVDRVLAGAPPPGEYAVAREVFGRPASFVPQVDPVVRVQYHRLRNELFKYYATEGRPSPVRLAASGGGFGIVVLNRAGHGAERLRRRLIKFVAYATPVVCLFLIFYFGFRPRALGRRAAVRFYLTAHALVETGSASGAARLFEQAVANDPNYAPAWSGLAVALVTSGSSTGTSETETVARAGEAANRAIKLDPGIGEAHAALAYVGFLQDSGWAAAESEFRRAIQLDPSSPRIHRMYAQGLLSRGRFDEAIAQATAAARLEPKGSPPWTDVAEILCAAHRYDEAIAEARRIVQQTGGSAPARLTLGIALSVAGHYDEAIGELQLAALGAHPLYALARLGYAYGAKGDHEAAEAVLSQLNRSFAGGLAIDWYYRALVYAGMGDAQNAVDCLENSYTHREADINFIGVEPAYARIRDDPRFLALRERLGLP
jgi:tetratricopeptide (TPR) repeat protein